MAPSRRAGLQWVDGVCRAGGSALNVRIQTLKRIVIELSRQVMQKRNVECLAPLPGAILAEKVWNRLRRNRRSYFASIQPSAPFFQTLYSSYQSFRLAGASLEAMNPSCFETAAKGNELIAFFREYAKSLADWDFIDYAEILHWAIHRLRRQEVDWPQDRLILVPEDIDACPMERDFLQALPEKNVISLPVDQPCVPPDGEEVLSDAALLRWLPNPSKAPAARGDGSATIFRAAGECNEVREVIRRCLGEGLRLDEVELIYTDRETYLPLIYEIAKGLQQEEGALKEGIPITFADGIPARYSRPGRALAMWIDWLRSDFAQAAMVQLIREGLILLPPEAEGEWNRHGLAALLRGAVVGFGRDRYLPKLNDHWQGLQEQIQNWKENGDDEYESQNPAQLRWKANGFHFLIETIRPLLEHLPSRGASADVLDAALWFLGNAVRCVSELDHNSLGKLTNEICELRSWFSEKDDSSLDVLQWLADLPAQANVLGSGPQPGHIHAASLASGGHSGRRHTFIVGLDDGRFPGALRQDPLLLDGERKKISSDIPASFDHQRRQMDDFYRLLCRLRGRIVLSYCCLDIKENRELFPSSALLSAYRILSQDRQADQSGMLDQMGPPASFAPMREEECLKENEWLLWRFCGSEPAAAPLAFAAQRFPHLGGGLYAATQRASDEFTIYDGKVPEAGALLDPTPPQGKIMSASAFETAGRCPLAFFILYALEILPPEEYVIDSGRWLEQSEFGKLLHNVFETFMSRLRENGIKPSYARDIGELMEILDDWAEQYKDRYPPANENAYRRQYGELKQAAQLFLKDEERFCQTRDPLYFEQSIGMKPGEEPALMPLPNGAVLRTRGVLDRIDRNEDGAYSVWDYKTGSTWKYRQTKFPPFHQGRVVQHVLYLALAEAWLKKNVSPQASVSQFGFFFPAAKGRGERIGYSVDELTEGDGVLMRLAQIIGKGVFAATNKVDDCRYCDYRLVCGNIDAVTEASQRKLDNLANAVLQPLRELRPDDKKNE
ncbi:MAG: PD-(D/E)XK nuclease family protein [Candidatus Omnitrophota bacterium]